MKKRMGHILLASILMLQFGGCGTEGTQSEAMPEVSGTKGAGDASQELSVSVGGILDPSVVWDLEGKDNSLDA